MDTLRYWLNPAGDVQLRRTISSILLDENQLLNMTQVNMIARGIYLRVVTETKFESKSLIFDHRTVY